MTTTDIPDRLPMGAVRLMGSWFNKLLDAVRRRTIIEGRGIRASATPNGVIVSCTVTPPQTAFSESKPIPWTLRAKGTLVQIYIPTLGQTSPTVIKLNDSILPSNHAGIADISYLSSYADEDDVGWYTIYDVASVGNGTYPIEYCLLWQHQNGNIAHYVSFGIRFSPSNADWLTNFSSQGTYFPTYFRPIGSLRKSEQGIEVVGAISGEPTLIGAKITEASGGGAISGGYYIPSIDEEGVLTWTPSDTGMPTIEPSNIKGDTGATGATGATGDAGKNGQNGAQGPTGADGGYYTPDVTDGILSWTPSDTGMPPIPDADIRGTGYTDEILEAVEVIAGNDSGTLYWYSDMLMTYDEIMDAVETSGVFLGATRAVYNPSTETWGGGGASYSTLSEFMNMGLSIPPPIGFDSHGNLATTGSAGNVGASGIGNTTTFAASNHSHAYVFADDIRPPETFLAMDGCTVSSTISVSGGVVLSSSFVQSKPISDTTGTPTGSMLGSTGMLPIPARQDHSHPLNVPEVYMNIAQSSLSPNDYVFPIAGPTGVFGEKPYYARIDHKHPLPTLGTGATGILYGNILDLPCESATEGAVISSNYGTGYNNIWKRETSFSATGGNAGFKMSVVTKIKYDNNSGNYVAYFRTLTFDAFGCVREISPITHGQVTGTF